MAEEQNKGINFNSANTGLNMDQSLSQIKSGTLTYALNATIESFDNTAINYQNEPGNEFCCAFPSGFVLIGKYFIQELDKHIFFITNDETKESEIGYMDHNDCIYRKLVNSSCLNFNINYPIHKVVHKKTNCSTEIYWTDGVNPRRHLDINNIPYVKTNNSTLCKPIYNEGELDCNQLKMQPNFSIPQLKVNKVLSGGDLTSGTYQFAIQYSDASSNGYTSYYSVTNPTPIFDPGKITLDFSYQVSKAIELSISNLDTTGQWEYFNLAVIKTVNAIPSVELVGTYFIDTTSKKLTYTGQNKTQIKLTIADIFEKYPYYDIAQDITTAQDILIWSNLTTIDKINYQSIANKIKLQWQTYRIPDTENYANEINATNLRGYVRDEVYAFEFVPLFRNGKQGDGFHIPGKEITAEENSLPLIDNTNPDYIGDGTPQPYWRVYNTAKVLGDGIGPNIGNATPYKYGEFGYWESTDEYDCREELWGELAGKPIRHHKMPDTLISPISENPEFVIKNNKLVPVDKEVAVYPLGIKINTTDVYNLIQQSNLSNEEKDNIIGFKIVRGDRSTNKSVMAKGMLRNVNSYTKEGKEYYFANYPYNDLNADPFINENNNAYKDEAQPWLIEITALNNLGEYKYSFVDPNNNKYTEVTVPNPQVGQILEFLSIGRPFTETGTAYICPGNYDVYYTDNRESVLIDCADDGFEITWTNPKTNNNTQYTIDESWVNSDEYSIVVKDGQIPGAKYYCGTAEGVFIAKTTPITMPVGIVEINEQITIFKENSSSIFPGFTSSATISPGKWQRSRRSSLSGLKETPLPFKDNKNKQVFNSPETSYGQPFIGNVLKLENVICGGGKAHFVEVKKNAKYKLITKEAQQDALEASYKIASITDHFDMSVLFAAYQSYLTIYINGITRKNFAYSFNSRSNYNYNFPIPNDKGVKQRMIDYSSYLIPVVQAVNETNPINNFQRENSVFIKTNKDIEYPNKTESIQLNGQPFIEDKSRFTISEKELCNAPSNQVDITVLSYYASIKNVFNNQWGQIYSYETIDTGFQSIKSVSTGIETIFGGDTFIDKHSYKTKVPFFIDNRVNGLDDADIFFDEIGNIGYPKYWHSARSIILDHTTTDKVIDLPNFISYKAHNFDCPNQPEKLTPPNAGAARTYYDGYFYLFAYGAPYFYCETSYNEALRQAFNNKEGEFYPHVSKDIPDDWWQESNVPIVQDNTYYYNVTYSKQNKENTFTHLPPDWENKLCFTNYPFRAIYSNLQNIDSDNKVNSWLIYLPVSYFDFPQNYGNLTSLDGIQNRAVLARFENKSLLYNNLLTMDTSNPQAAYLGNPNLFKGSPPIDFAETDLGYIGSQNKMLLKIPQGQVTADAKRGQIFLIQGTQAEDLSAFGLGLNKFFTDHLAFEILRYFPNVNTDNHFNGIGLHGVYDTKYDRILITKLDYIPLSSNIKYDKTNQEYYIITNNVRNQVSLLDSDYFCNKSWTLSFSFNTKSWISFHSYLPNFYIGENNFFYSGLNTHCSDLDIDFNIVAGTTNKRYAAPETIPFDIVDNTPTEEVITTDCQLSGTAIIKSCDLQGTAIITIPPTTTTTLCYRPYNLTTYTFFIGYIENSVTFDSTISLETACQSINITKNYPNCFTPLYMGVQAESLYLNSKVYVLNNSMDCTTVADGWYYTTESHKLLFAYRLAGGYIVEKAYCSSITTTTTTTFIPNTYDYTITVDGSMIITYKDNTNTTQTLTIEDTTVNICCQLDSINIIENNGIMTLCKNNPC